MVYQSNHKYFLIWVFVVSTGFYLRRSLGGYVGNENEKYICKKNDTSLFQNLVTYIYIALFKFQRERSAQIN